MSHTLSVCVARPPVETVLVTAAVKGVPTKHWVPVPSGAIFAQLRVAAAGQSTVIQDGTTALPLRQCGVGSV